MIKECLNTLSNTKIDIGDKRKGIIKRYTSIYEEEQLLNIMRTPQGLLVEDITIHYFPNAGFRCSNDTTFTGKLPICNILQRILNEQLSKNNG
jgi:hypothetical protein